MSTRRSFLAAAAVALPALAGCLDVRPGGQPSRPDALEPRGSAPAPGPTSGPGRPTGPADGYAPGSMPHAPDSMPHGPGGDRMHGGPYAPRGGSPSQSPPRSPVAANSSLATWFADVDNYEGVVDRTGSETVRVAVGAPGNGGAFAFDAAAIRVSPGTRVVWEWTGAGGSHDVASVDGAFASDLLGAPGATFAVTFDDAGIYRYVCRPHRSLGMKGAILVE